MKMDDTRNANFMSAANSHNPSGRHVSDAQKMVLNMIAAGPATS